MSATALQAVGGTHVPHGTHGPTRCAFALPALIPWPRRRVAVGRVSAGRAARRVVWSGGPLGRGLPLHSGGERGSFREGGGTRVIRTPTSR